MHYSNDSGCEGVEQGRIHDNPHRVRVGVGSDKFGLMTCFGRVGRILTRPDTQLPLSRSRAGGQGP